MLPTMGLYKTIDCPYYENSCHRPYCHFRHRKKSADPETASSASTEVPTYNPTPKSQLANVKSHIPISYVPDLAKPSENSSFRMYRFNESLPTYKPTPLSVLGSTAKTNSKLENDAKAEEEEEEEISCDVNFDELKNEFDIIDELISDNAEKIKQPSKQPTAEPPKVKTKDSKSKEKSKTRDKSKSSSEDKSKHSSKSKPKSSKDDRSRSHSSKRESKSSSKDKHYSSRKDKSDHDNKNKKSRESTSSRKKKKEKKKSPKIEENGEDLGNGKFELQDFELSDLDEDPIEECYKIFTEYKPTEPEICPEVIKSVEEQPVMILKKRIAHENVDKNKPKTFHSLKPAIPNAAQIMVNRFKAIRQMQANEEQKVDYISEIKKHVLKRPPEEAPPKTVPAKIPKMDKIAKPDPSKSLIDDIISGKPSKPRRIAPVQNVNSIQRAKAKIEEMAKMKVVNSIVKTTAQSTKGERRVAHTPEVLANSIPDLLGSEHSKLPVNVRTRYLSMIFDECAKLYMRVEEAQQRASNEEYKCYERCAALVTYRNSAMLAINRLRKELQEREMSGLGPIFPGDTTTVSKDSGSEIKGSKFYGNIKQFVLEEAELVLHGFPREGRKPGLGKVPVQKRPSKIGLDDFDRVCCRCSKLYRVDEEGFALYEEECLYHPLKKRTFRGESFYLCCKSGDGFGCATATTHVSESDKGDSDGEIEGYQMTMPADGDDDPRNTEVFALDCEMCYTTKGLELTRVTIVNSECKTVYESLVKPLNPIIDYNTRFSGITKEQMNRTATSILQVQANILHLCNANTILIGHSLESDMKALKIIHSKIIDTSVLFPHKFGLPHKRALRDLAREFLKKIIQNDVHGHDSAEDALTCMELVQWKVKESFKSRGIKT